MEEFDSLKRVVVLCSLNNKTLCSSLEKVNRHASVAWISVGCQTDENSGCLGSSISYLYSDTDLEEETLDNSSFNVLNSLLRKERFCCLATTM